MRAITCSARAPVGIPIALDDMEACGAHQCAWRFLDTPRRVGGKTRPTHGYTVNRGTRGPEASTRVRILLYVAKLLS